MRREVMAGVLSVSLMFSACADNSETIAPESTLSEASLLPGSNEALEMQHVALFFDSPMLAEFQPDVYERYAYEDEVFDFHTVESLEQYGSFVEQSLPFIRNLADTLPTFGLTFSIGDELVPVQYTPTPRGDSVSTLILVEGDFETGLSVEGLTNIKEFSNPQGETAYTRSVTVVSDTTDPSESPIMDAIRSTDTSIFIEMAQSLISVSVDSVESDLSLNNLYIEGQELLANSLGRVYVAAKVGLTYDQYVTKFENSLITVTGNQLPMLIAPEDLYRQMEEFVVEVHNNNS